MIQFSSIGYNEWFDKFRIYFEIKCLKQIQVKLEVNYDSEI